MGQPSSEQTKIYLSFNVLLSMATCHVFQFLIVFQFSSAGCGGEKHFVKIKNRVFYILVLPLFFLYMTPASSYLK
jgi:hypothetical protein